MYTAKSQRAAYRRGGSLPSRATLGLPLLCSLPVVPLAAAAAAKTRAKKHGKSKGCLEARASIFKSIILNRLLVRAGSKLECVELIHYSRSSADVTCREPYVTDHERSDLGFWPGGLHHIVVVRHHLAAIGAGRGSDLGNCSDKSPAARWFKRIQRVAKNSCYFITKNTAAVV